MINIINDIKKNIKNKRITILGAGISGQGAALLGLFVGCKILISDIKKNGTINNKKLKKNIEFEFGKHSKKCLNTDLIIVSPGINLKNVKIINDAIIRKIPIITEIEFSSWFTKSPIIAVTGSNGKSTTVKIINEIFSRKYKNIFLGGNIGKSLSENVYLELKNNTKCIHIVEISSFQLEHIYTFKPFVSCILNITEDHLDRYKCLKDYFITKTNITKNHDKESFVVYNQDDTLLNNFYKSYKNKKPFSIKNKNNDIVIDKKNIYFKNDKVYLKQSEINLIGEHNLYNIVAAVTIAAIFKLKNSIIIESIKKFKPLAHRLEILDIFSDIKFINDSKGTNIYSTKSAIESINENIVLILGGSKDTIERKQLIEVINKKHIIKIICYGEIGYELFILLRKIKPTKYNHIFKEAVKEAIKIANKDDLVLLSPAFKSYDQFNNFEERGNEFKKIINQHYA